MGWHKIEENPDACIPSITVSFLGSSRHKMGTVCLQLYHTFLFGVQLFGNPLSRRWMWIIWWLYSYDTLNISASCSPIWWSENYHLQNYVNIFVIWYRNYADGFLSSKENSSSFLLLNDAILIFHNLM